MNRRSNRQSGTVIGLLSRLAMGALLLAMLAATPQDVAAQDYDMVIKNGHVIDARNGINEVMDVAIHDGEIARVASNIPESSAEQVVDASGHYVTPGLIDIHSHNYYGTEPYRSYSNGFSALPPDGFTFRAGVTTVVDVGGAGWKNFRHFKDQVIDRVDTRVLAFINIVGDGMSGLREQNMNDMDPKMTGLVANQFPEIVGVKIAHYRGHDWEPYKRAVEAAEMADIPVMVDFGGAEPALSLRTLFFDVFRPGDIYTHAFGGQLDADQAGSGRQAVVDENGDLRPGMLEAQERGIIFDVGHGGGSFFYPIAVPAIEQGLWPDVISTDIHVGSMNDGMKDMLNVVSKMHNMGMSLPDAFEASTWKPAQVIQREDLGHLSEGAVADLAIFSYHEGEFGYLDSNELLMPGTSKLQTELTVREGRVVYDLNGLAAPLWNE
ncbi:MAG: amidohydrolase/deacetylase family metallohydrolase [Bacteroidota bacterium]